MGDNRSTSSKKTTAESKSESTFQSELRAGKLKDEANEVTAKATQTVAGIVNNAFSKNNFSKVADGFVSRLAEAARMLGKRLARLALSAGIKPEKQLTKPRYI